VVRIIFICDVEICGLASEPVAVGQKSHIKKGHPTEWTAVFLLFSAEREADEQEDTQKAHDNARENNHVLFLHRLEGLVIRSK
jgi:hypothetical protein